MLLGGEGEGGGRIHLSPSPKLALNRSVGNTMERRYRMTVGEETW